MGKTLNPSVTASHGKRPGVGSRTLAARVQHSGDDERSAGCVRQWEPRSRFLGEFFVVIEGFENQDRSTAARLSLTRVQLVDCALQLFKLLSSLAELAFRCQTLVVGKVFGGFRDERVEIRCGLW